MISGSARSIVCHQLLRRDRPLTFSIRLMIAGGAMVLALVALVVAGGQWRLILAGAAISISMLSLIRCLSWLVKPVAAYVGVWLAFNILRASADDTAWANQVLAVVPRFERWLAGGRLPSEVLQEAFYEPGRIDLYDYGWTIVYLSFFVVPHLVALLLLWRSRTLFWHYAFATAMLFSLAMVGFFIIPTSPPWLVTEVAPSGNFADMRRITEAMLIRMDLPVRLFNHAELGTQRASEFRLEPNPIAAMPSIHFAATALVALSARRAGALLFGAAVVYLGLMSIALVYLGEHYVIDLVVGGGLAWVGWAVVGLCTDPQGRRGRGEEPPVHPEHHVWLVGRTRRP